MRNALLAIIFFVHNVAHGQNELQGVLTDDDGVGIAYATVSLSADSLNLEMVDYAVTDDNGKWSINNASASGRYLTFASLGYSPKTVLASQSKEVQLQRKQNEIGEIVLKSRRIGVLAKQDTLVYSPETFKTGDETNLGDVISKLPGMQVGEGGKISFNGKDVNKILVNGKDILQSSGSAALGTLPADFAQSVELLQNYTTNNVTPSFDNEKTLALDIKTGKSSTSGTVSLGGGLEKTAEIKASVFNIGNHVSESLIINANNTGEPVFSIIDYIHSFGRIKSQGGVQTIGIDEEFRRILMPSENRYKSANSIANANIDLSKADRYKAQLMVLGNIYHDQAKENQSITHIDLGSQSYSSIEGNKTNRFVTSVLNQEWNTNATHNITSSTLFRANLSDDNMDVRVSKPSATDSLSQTEKANSFYFQESLTSNKLLGTGLFSSHIDLGLERNRDRLTITSLENKEHLKTYVLADVSYKRPILSNSIYISGKISIDNHCEKYIVCGNERMRSTAHTHQLGLMRNKSVVQFDAGLRIVNVLARAQLMGQTIRQRTWHIEPRASFRLKFSNQHELNISFQKNNGLAGLKNLSRSQRNERYDWAMAPSEVEDVSTSRNALSVNYFLMNLYSRTTFLCVANLTDKRGPTTDSFTKEAMTTSHYADGGRQKTAFLRASINQGLPIPIDIKAIGELSRYKKLAYTNSLANELNGECADWTLGVTSRATGSVVNVELAIRRSADTNRMKLVDVSTHNNATDAEAKLLFKWCNARGYAGYAYRSVSNGNRSALHDISFLCSYKMRTVDIQVVASNMLHLDSYAWRTESISESKCTHSEYSRMPGFVMLRIAKSIL